MRINTRIRQLVNDRLALVAQAQEIKQSLQSIPRVKHIRHEYSMVKIADLSAEEQAKIIRMESKPR